MGPLSGCYAREQEEVGNVQTTTCGGGASGAGYGEGEGLLSGQVGVDPIPGGSEVEDVEGAVKDLQAKGVKFEEYDVPGLKTVNGIASMGGSKLAWFKDSEGNLIVISLPVPVAAPARA